MTFKERQHGVLLGTIKVEAGVRVAPRGLDRRAAQRTLGKGLDDGRVHVASTCHCRGAAKAIGCAPQRRGQHTPAGFVVIASDRLQGTIGQDRSRPRPEVLCAS